ncbi:hypothetical protein ACOMHN_001317 [Nucella lapillus]
MSGMLWATLVGVLLTARTAGQLEERVARHTALIVLGGTGDLARKYLWQAVFDALMTREGSDATRETQQWTLTLAAGGTAHPSVATARLKDILDNSVQCSGRHGSESVCRAKRAGLMDRVNYFQLLATHDYKAMCETLAAPLAREASGVVKEVVIYLSVPPSVFLPALGNFKSQCAFPGQDVSFKVVLEKPQGHDLASAQRLSQDLLSLFEEDELYRTDHYLFKSVATCILPFRAANPQLERMLNRDYVERVEVFVKETIGVQDRHSLYNELGVIRDVFQNHLTQLMTLVTLDLPANLTSSAIEQAKVKLLQQVSSVTPSSLLLGQYASYVFDAAKEVPDTNASALVPTYAAALLKIRSPRWLDVPVVLVSGKKLDQRVSYVRVLFKDNHVCVSGCDGTGGNTPPSPHATHDQGSGHHHHHHYPPLHQPPRPARRQVVFHLGHGASSLPLVSVSRALGEPRLPEVLQEVHDSEVFSSTHAYHQDQARHLYHATPRDGVPAYSALMEHALRGRRHRFVSTPQLLQAWRVWDQVLTPPATPPPAPAAVTPDVTPRLYDARDPMGLLNAVVKGDKLEFAVSDGAQDGKGEGELPPLHHLHQAQTPATFLGQRMVTGTKEGVALQLAREIERAAVKEIGEKGVFHVAFSGGSTPTLLWHTLAQSFNSDHWANVHVWQVDERCVRAAADTNSNLFQLDRHLLRFIALPWSHVHAMPVDVAGRLCDPELQGDRQYADSLRHHVPNLQLDYVVVGVGGDGHTASLFPHTPALSADRDTLVMLTEQAPPPSPRRMTLTLPLINRAKRVAVLVSGEEKQDILEKLEDSSLGGGGQGQGHRVVDRYPILGVHPANGTLSWFVDYLAYFGHDYFDLAED